MFRGPLHKLHDDLIYATVYMSRLKLEIWWLSLYPQVDFKEDLMKQNQFSQTKVLKKRVRNERLDIRIS